jgi:hypothetical protein
MVDTIQPSPEISVFAKFVPPAKFIEVGYCEKAVLDVEPVKDNLLRISAMVRINELLPVTKYLMF